MKKILLIISLLICSDVYAQTEDLEIKNLAERYSRAEFTQAEYSQLAKDWRQLLSSLGGYPKLPYNEETKQIEFISSMSFKGLEKKVIYDRVMEWGALTFGSLNNVLQYSNPDNGKIILKGWFEVRYKKDTETFFSSRKEMITKVRCNFTEMITIKDDKLKAEVKNIMYEYSTPYYLSGNTYIPESTIEYPLSSLYPVTDTESVSWKGRIDLINRTYISLISDFKSLEKYINNTLSDYNF